MIDAAIEIGILFDSAMVSRYNQVSVDKLTIDEGFSNQWKIKNHATSNEQRATSNFGDHEITYWLSRARQNDEVAFGKLFGFYIGRLRLYLKNKLTGQDRAEGFEDDLANESMFSVWHGLTEGRFESVTNREELWFAMMCVAKARALNRRKYLRRKKRLLGIPNQLASIFNCSVDLSRASDELEIIDVWEKFTESLPNDEYREIVRMKLDGMDVNEIAIRFDSVPRGVQRKLRIVQVRWEAFVASQNYF